MEGFFVREPKQVKDAEKIVKWATKHRMVPVEIYPIATVKLDYMQYMRFCDAEVKEWDFLEPYVEVMRFEDELHADCVIVETRGQRRIAICLECNAAAYVL